MSELMCMCLPKEHDRVVLFAQQCVSVSWLRVWTPEPNGWVGIPALPLCDLGKSFCLSL